ncbi:3-dehydroquinate synthase [Halalkalibaculum sp. DA3122]|uniref:3-dehydroquinate synthase n=1 Tax=unclassified Halalkalibaculum TaxID=2964617 RepID=UPI00375428AE
MPRQLSTIKQEFSVPFTYDVCFTEGLFDPDNDLFANLIQSASPEVARKVLFVFDEGMYEHHPDLFERVKVYAGLHKEVFTLVDTLITVPGGEAAKNDPDHVDMIHEAINEANLDRHSYVTVIGGGAVIDTAGYAAATAHRGIRTIRVPTTVLAQNDAAVGVKNGINAFGKKNFLGTFVPPFAVINDIEFLDTLDQRDWRSGVSEAIKVALLKDADFFRFLEENASRLDNREAAPMQKLIYRCAELHLEHIATSGDPFEMGSSRPLDFGHWAAHKLEQLTGYDLRHGEAVAIGIALDVTYSYLSDMISRKEWERVLQAFKNCGFDLYVPELKSKLDQPEDEDSLFHGLEEFREHLGGELTIMLLESIGEGTEVHEVDLDRFTEAITRLQNFEKQPA